MAISQITSSTYADALKILQQGKITEMLHEEESFFKLITSKFEKGNIAGKKLVLPLKNILGHAAIQSIAYNGSFVARQKVLYDNIEAGYKFLTGHIEMDAVEMEMANSKEGGFIDLMDDELKSKNKAMAQQLSRQIFGDGSGVLAVVSGASTTVNTSYGRIPLRSNASDQGSAYWFEIGDILKILDATGGGSAYEQHDDLAASTGYCKVVDVDYEGNTIDVIGITTATVATTQTEIAWSPSTALAAGDLLVRSGTTYTASSTIQDTASEEMVGFDGIIDATAAQTLWGISKTSVPQFKAQTRDLNGELLQVSHLMEQAKRVQARGGKINLALCSFDTQLRLAEIGLAMRSISEPKMDVTLGIETPRLVVPHGGAIPIVASRYCPSNKFYMLDTKDWEFRGYEPKLVDLDGKTLRMQTSADGGYKNSVTSELFGAMVVLCKSPFKNGKVYNFINSEA